MEHLRRHVGRAEPGAQAEECPELAVFRRQGGKKLRGHRRRVPLGRYGPEAGAAGPALLGTRLEPDEGRERRVPQRRGDRLTPVRRQEESQEGEAETDEEGDRVAAAERAIRRAQHAQMERTLLYFS